MALHGGDNNDTLTGTDSDDLLYGYTGVDHLTGGVGADILYGFDGDDTLTGSTGADSLYGQADNDTLSGGDGNDTLDGGGNDDSLDGGDGNDTLYGDRASSSASYANTISALNPISHWRLEDGGSTAADAEGTVNEGGVSAGDETTGVGTAATTFDGTDDHVVVNHNAAFELSDGAIQLWFRPDSVSGNQTILSKDATGTGNSNLEISFNGSAIEVQLDDGSSAHTVTTATGAVTQGEWSHLVLNFGTGGLELIVDGVTAATDAYAGGLDAAAGGGNGGFVSVWESNGQDGSGRGIYGQRYDSDGNATGSEFRVNTTTSSSQDTADVESLSDGGFVVVWESDNQDGDDDGVYGQRYDANGNAAGSEFRVNEETDKDQEDPTVTGLDGGGFVVTWWTDDQDGSGKGFYARQYDANGNATTGEFEVNTYTSAAQTEPSVTALGDGGYVIAWRSQDQDPGGSGGEDGVYGQRYDANGNAQGSEFRINSTTDDDEDTPDIAGLDGGGFVAVWESDDQDGEDDGVYGQRFDASGNKVGSGKGVYARQYDASGNAVGNEFEVNTYTSSNQTAPSVTALGDGGYVIAWQSQDQEGAGSDADDGVYGQRYDASGNAVGGEFRLNTTTAGDQQKPAVAGLGSSAAAKHRTAGDRRLAGQLDGRPGRQSDGLFRRRDRRGRDHRRPADRQRHHGAVQCRHHRHRRPDERDRLGRYARRRRRHRSVIWPGRRRHPHRRRRRRHLDRYRRRLRRARRRRRRRRHDQHYVRGRVGR